MYNERLVNKLFPSLSKQEVQNRVAEHWEMGRFPFPIFDMECDCGNDNQFQAQWWKFFVRDKGGSRYRCDVQFKCTCCSRVRKYGVVIPEWVWELHGGGQSNKVYHWRQVKRYMENNPDLKG